MAVMIMINSDAVPGAELAGAAHDVVLGLPPARIKRSLNRTVGRTLLEQGAAAVIQQYRALKAAAPDEYDFSESELNRLGYWLLGRDRTAEAVKIFELNVEAHPGRANPHDSLGEAYLKLGRRDLALASYRKALELDPSMSSAARALKELEPERVRP
jgi:tetratricopeptide (TPR) repeat protein